MRNLKEAKLTKLRLVDTYIPDELELLVEVNTLIKEVNNDNFTLTIDQKTEKILEIQSRIRFYLEEMRLLGRIK